MSNTAAPYGLRPVKRADNTPYSGAFSTYLIDPAGYNTNIFNGSVVYLNDAGYINICTATGADATTNVFPAGSSSVTGAIGVFVGCSYVNAQGQLMFSQYYPANTTGVVQAFVVDDPNVLFQGQLDGTATQSILGTNTFLAAVQSTSTGSTTTGNSTSALDATVQTGTAAFRVLGFASPIGDSYPDVLVKFNPGYHSMTLNVGL